MARNQECPICKRLDAERTTPPQAQDSYRVDCGHCGKFLVLANLPALVWEKLDENGKKLLADLPAYIKEKNKEGIEPEISDENWKAYAREGLRLSGRLNA